MPGCLYMLHESKQRRPLFNFGNNAYQRICTMTEKFLPCWPNKPTTRVNQQKLKWVSHAVTEECSWSVHKMAVICIESGAQWQQGCATNRSDKLRIKMMMMIVMMVMMMASNILPCTRLPEHTQINRFNLPLTKNYCSLQIFKREQIARCIKKASLPETSTLCCCVPGLRNVNVFRLRPFVLLLLLLLLFWIYWRPKVSFLVGFFFFYYYYYYYY